MNLSMHCKCRGENILVADEDEIRVDFYVKLGFIVNFNNRPIEGASDVDYVSTLSIGWKWDRK